MFLGPPPPPEPQPPSPPFYARSYYQTLRDLRDPLIFSRPTLPLPDVCSICQHPYAPLTLGLRCGHALHETCAHELLKRFGRDAKCPMCRAPVYEQKSAQVRRRASTK
jgi:hypothetical protein